MKSKSVLYILVLLLSIAAIPVRSQTLSPEASLITDSIALHRVFHCPRVGINGDASKLWQKYEKLEEVATNNELFVLLKHKNKVVNCYAFLALNNRTDHRLFDFVLDNLTDNRVVATKCFDVIRSCFMNDFYLSSLSDSSLTDDQRSALDSTLVFDMKIQSAYKNQLINDLPLEERYYTIVRHYAENGNGQALVNLARYQRNEDKALIIQRAKQKKDAYFGFKAMREFPDKDFLRILPGQFRKRWYQFHYNYSEFRMIYQALAQYPNSKKTIRVFRKTTHALGRWKRNTFSQYVKLAIMKYPHSNFDEILKKIKLSDYSEKMLNSLLESDL